MLAYPRLGRPVRTSSNSNTVETIDIERLGDCMRIVVGKDNKKVGDVEYREFV
jgi:hypothetical protein